MDPIVGVWLTSLIGAGGFTAAGYILGQRATAQLVGATAAATVAAVGHTPNPAAVDLDKTPIAPSIREAVTPTPGPARLSATPPPVFPSARPPPVRPSRPPPPVRTSEPPPAAYVDTPLSLPPKMPKDLLPRGMTPLPNLGGGDTGVGPLPNLGTSSRTLTGHIDAEEDIERPTVVPISTGDAEALKNELRAAQDHAATAIERARIAELGRGELEKDLSAMQERLTREIITRASAEARVEELSDRLAAASEEATRLRHKVATLDRQGKQLREALQGRVRALTNSELQRRRDLEQADEMRSKLRGVAEKIERSSVPPPNMSSLPPVSLPFSMPYSSLQGSRGIEDIGALTEEIARLKDENRSLRARALGSPQPKAQNRDSIPVLDLEPYRRTVNDVATISGMRGAVLADDVGSLLIGTGELAEGLAAFGAFIRDASLRTDGLLPLEGADEIIIRDRRGTFFWTRLVVRDLSLVVLGDVDSALGSAKQIVKERLRLDT